MAKFKTMALVVDVLAVLGVSSLALAQPAPAKVTLLNGAHACNGSALKVFVQVSGGATGMKGKVTVKRDSYSWVQPFDVQPPATNVYVNTNWANCHRSGPFIVKV